LIVNCHNQPTAISIRVLLTDVDVSFSTRRIIKAKLSYFTSFPARRIEKVVYMAKTLIPTETNQERSVHRKAEPFSQCFITLIKKIT